MSKKDIIRITKEKQEELSQDRKHLFRVPKTKVLICTRPLDRTLNDAEGYIDLCYYDHVSHSWKGVFPIDKIPSSEKNRLGSLYSNKEVVLYCKESDLDDLIKQSSKDSKVIEKRQSKAEAKIKAAFGQS